MSDLLCCPYCKGESGFHFKFIERRSLHHEWNGRPCGGSEPDPIRGGKKLYCDECDRDVTKFVTPDYSHHQT